MKSKSVSASKKAGSRVKPGMTEVGTGCPLHTAFLIFGANLDRHPSTDCGRWRRKLYVAAIWGRVR